MRRLLPLTLTAAVALVGAAPALADYPWPVRPFDRPHPIRANFGDPRWTSDGYFIKPVEAVHDERAMCPQYAERLSDFFH